MLLQTSLSQIPMLISEYLLQWKNLSFEREFNNEFNNSIIAIKLPPRQIKDFDLKEATESLIGILRFFVGISEKYLWKRSFFAVLQAIGLQFY